MARTAVLREFQHSEEYDLSEDFELWSRIAATNKLATLPEVLGRCRRHSGRISQEKAFRMKDRRLTIYAAQLHALGIVFSDADLERHFLLRSMRKQKFTPDREYLQWAETWLLELQAANQHALCYPEPAFSELLGRLWLKVCWYAQPNLGWTVWRQFWRCGLSKNIWTELRKFVSLSVPHFSAERE
jgi:hypothetical protein